MDDQIQAALMEVAETMRNGDDEATWEHYRRLQLEGKLPDDEGMRARVAEKCSSLSFALKELAAESEGAARETLTEAAGLLWGMTHGLLENRE